VFILVKSGGNPLIQPFSNVLVAGDLLLIVILCDVLYSGSFARSFSMHLGMLPLLATPIVVSTATKHFEKAAVLIPFINYADFNR